MVGETTSSTGVNEGAGVSNLTKGTMVEGNRKFYGLGVSTSYKDLSNVGGQ